jgi:hypothetical protein
LDRETYDSHLHIQKQFLEDLTSKLPSYVRTYIKGFPECGLRRTFGYMREEVTGGWRKSDVPNWEFHDL